MSDNKLPKPRIPPPDYLYPQKEHPSTLSEFWRRNRIQLIVFFAFKAGMWFAFILFLLSLRVQP